MSSDSRQHDRKDGVGHPAVSEGRQRVRKSDAQVLADRVLKQGGPYAELHADLVLRIGKAIAQHPIGDEGLYALTRDIQNVAERLHAASERERAWDDYS